MHINFNKKSKRYKEIIEQVFNATIKKLNISYKKLETSVVFVNKRTIKKLNEVFREVHAVTDVLSFPFLKNTRKENGDITKNTTAIDYHPQTKHLLLGDIYICLAVAKKQAKKYNHSLDREVVYLALHGLLHLLGYDHLHEADKVEMREIEEDILSDINLSRDSVKKVMVAIGK